MPIKDTNAGEQLPEMKARVEKYQPIYYGGASGDFNPIHIDPEFGKMVGLGGNILQGLCTMAFTARFVVNEAGGDPGSLKSIRVRFAKPVKPGDNVVVHGKTVEKSDTSAKLEFLADTKNGENQVITHGEAVVSI